MKKSVLGLCVLAAFGVASSGAMAAEWKPSKPIELIIPAAPGGNTDLSARTFAKYAQKKFGKPVVIVNVKGAGGFNGIKAAHDANPDGHKVLYFHANVVTTNLMGTSPYDHTGFEVGPQVVEDASLTMFAGPKSGIKNLKGMVDAAKANPGKIKVATEYGAFTYFMLVKLQRDLGIKLNMIDVGSDSEKVTAMLGGFIDLMPKSTLGTADYVKNGDMLPLGVMQEKRPSNAAEIPTFGEQGIKFTYPAYPFTMFFPKGTPADAQAKFDKVAKEVAADPDFQKDLIKVGVVARYRSPAEASKNFDAIKAELSELAKLKMEVGKGSK